MPSRDEGVSLSALREAVRERVDATGLTAVARDVGMHHQSLRSFLNGSVPHGANRKRLWAWYERTQAPHAMAKALTGMLETVPPEMRDDAMRELAMTVERVHRAAGVEPPGWVTELLGR